MWAAGAGLHRAVADGRGEGSDRFWISVSKPSADTSGLSIKAPGATYAVPLSGGNIAVPHSGKRR